MTPVGDRPLALVTGASGFIGRAVVDAAPGPVRVLHHRTPPMSGHPSIHGDLLDPTADFAAWTHEVGRVLHLARPAAGSGWRRRRIARRTNVATGRFVAHLLREDVQALAVHGSLSYGDRGEDLVQTSDPVRPTGYATAYARGEAPWRAAVDAGHLALVRAPWVLGPGSWFDMLYAGPTVPVIEGGQAWMSIVTTDGLARWLWTQSEARGVLHPPLLARLRQADFAMTVAEVRGVPTTDVGASLLTARHGHDATRSIVASLRLDDGHGDLSEGEPARAALRDAVHAVVASRS